MGNNEEVMRQLKRFNETGKRIEGLFELPDAEQILSGLFEAFEEVQDVFRQILTFPESERIEGILVRYMETLAGISERIEQGVYDRHDFSILMVEHRVRVVDKLLRVLLKQGSSVSLDDPDFSSFMERYSGIALDRFGDDRILSRIDNYDRVYIWGSDHESILTYICFVHMNSAERITGFLCEDGGEQILDKKVEGVSDIFFKQDDAVILCGDRPIRKDDVRYLENIGISNLIEWNVYDERGYGYYAGLREEMYASELKFWFREMTGKTLDLDNPKGWNEGIQWMKLNESDALKTRLADKFLVRDWVKDKIGEEYLVPLYGVWDSFDEIDIDALPDKFVLKCNHGSGFNLIVDDKKSIDWAFEKERFDIWMNSNFAFIFGLELHYKDIPPKILAEKKLEVAGKHDIDDYKVFVFQGEVKFIQVDVDRFVNHRRNIYSKDWELLPYRIGFPTAPDVIIDKPDCLDELLRVSETLGKGFRHVRVDFYIVDDHIYFGEMTFTHGSGMEKVEPESFNLEMGKWMGF
ncbi:MAG: hypothetical protein K6F34_09690 [Lachnospiraceae bacterium]|nr:hypothetical protein [Lachnospiraceae bacterium]